jgi:hypothetical protein
MKGYIYIASAFETVNRSVCGQRNGWVDNDPHFWTNPPTWGICRNDLRAAAAAVAGDVIFFVLPKRGKHPQCLFGYLTIEKIVSHLAAYRDPRLRSKRMGNKHPNGNIIVTADGKYNRFDGQVHFYKWEKIARHYAVGCEGSSRLLTAADIQRKAPSFLPVLRKILGKSGDRAIDLISRRGAKLNPEQVAQLLAWVDSP